MLLGKGVWAGERDTIPNKAGTSVSLYSQRITSIQVSRVSYPNLPAGLGMRLGISPEVMTHHITLTYLYS